MHVLVIYVCREPVLPVYTLPYIFPRSQELKWEIYGRTTLQATVGKQLEREREGEFNRERRCVGCCETEK
jgi:hypothetical protein